MLRTVFTEIKINVPFHSHPEVVQLLRINGIDMGVHHYDKNAATRMTQSMSSYMHRQLLQHMLSKNLPFSIILDGSCDNTDNHYMIIYFQILENNVPSVVFYRLVETSSDVTALGYFNTITEKFKSEESDFYNYFKENLVGYISDGENVMMGENGGLISHVRKVAKNPVFAVHCMAHRIHLAINKAYSSIPYFLEFDKFINELFKFYNQNAPKRKTHLRETANKLNTTFYELNYIYRTRWISSEFQAISNIRKVWPLIVRDLSEINRESLRFELDVRQKAVSFSKKLKGKNFLILLNFIYDVLEHLSFWSRKMQERSALLVDFGDFKDKITQTFDSLKTQNGKGINLLLENCTCDQKKCTNIETYYNSKNVAYSKVLLVNDRGTSEIIPYLHEIRNTFSDNVKSQISSYLPMNDLSLFNIFRPSLIPSKSEDSLTYGVREITSLCRIFKFNDCVALLNE